MAGTYPCEACGGPVPRVDDPTGLGIAHVCSRYACGAWHGAPCRGCGRRAVHTDGCPERPRRPEPQPVARDPDDLPWATVRRDDVRAAATHLLDLLEERLEEMSARAVDVVDPGRAIEIDALVAEVASVQGIVDRLEADDRHARILRAVRHLHALFDDPPPRIEVAGVVLAPGGAT